MKYVTIRQLSEQLGIDKSNAAKIVKALGVPTTTARSIDTGWQAATALTEDDAAAVVEYRRKRGFPIAGDEKTVVRQVVDKA